MELQDVGPVTTSVPGVATCVHVLRTVAASVASRLPLSLDDVDDLRLAVDEAAARLLQLPGTRRLTLEISRGSDGLELAVSSDGSAEAWPEPDAERTLPWKILTALVTRVVFERDGGTGRIRLTKRVNVPEVRS